ncbi:monofunctional biosynthetic peptidoglycan transglycosylase [Elioraea sp. Yellowstone]|uniref:monofunctional biosynthetic peptidoglycan transglycosylase n=1 Tax=Elioraea sp. Yellowstone TaxID=2592070 RepID=UPI001150F25A|nr:monofunctional biosynthetic peptidoglycan transglycosylase [Elioraea sp. Yellowstone]TQF77373.1 monofunctional biosynthetic peptidoglycan transglycosylase [Elioraea sp. Yellowstone]
MRRRVVRALLIAFAAALLLPAAVVLAYRFVPPPATPLMVIRSIDGHGRSREWVPLDRISPFLVRAVIAAEDQRFCAHWGFDAVELRRAVDDWRDGGRLRGASTLTQQTAKNLFLWPRSDWLRKALEVYPTLLIELLWPKRRIVEVYLNVVEFGPGLYGAEAASRALFGRGAAALTPVQASLLAAVLPNPLGRNASRPEAHVSTRAPRLRGVMDQVDTACL